MAAYHTLCSQCVGSDAAITAMEKKRGSATAETPSEPTSGDAEELVEDDGIIGDDTAQEDANSNETNDAKSQSTSGEKNDTKSRRKVCVCAICASEPALSKYANVDPALGEIVDKIEQLEDTLESGVHDNGHKMTLREVKGVERQLEKLKLEIKEKGKKTMEENSEEDDVVEDGSSHGDDDGWEEQDDASGSSNDVDSIDNNDEVDDPFLLAVGGKNKLLVGEEYQKMLLAREQQKQS